MSKEQQELMDEAYKNYLNRIDDKFREEDVKMDAFRNAMNYTKIDYTVEEFINKCKNDKDFSEKWGLKIEERELSFEERCEIQIDRLEGMYSSEKEVFIQHSVNDVKQIIMDKNNIPTKLITITYKDKTIESYE
jgi:hypothetical protein